VKAFEPTHRFTAAEETQLLEAAIPSPVDGLRLVLDDRLYDRSRQGGETRHAAGAIALAYIVGGLAASAAFLIAKALG
jgi:hypothetical protein